jgi:hypothetical protein
VRFFVCAPGSVTEPNTLDFEIPIEDTGIRRDNRRFRPYASASTAHT